MEIDVPFCEEFIKLYDLPYKAVKLLGRGKSGYSFLCEQSEGVLKNKQITLKIMHDEPCSYYNFSENKVELEILAYKKLSTLGVHIPRLLEFSVENNYLTKEFIEGVPCNIVIANGSIKRDTIKKVLELGRELALKGFNIDYFPTNFVQQGGELFYIDYEINPYDFKWSFENWGIYYWLNTKGFRMYNLTKDAKYINSDDLGTPIKAGMEELVLEYLSE